MIAKSDVLAELERRKVTGPEWSEFMDLARALGAATKAEIEELSDVIRALRTDGKAVRDWRGLWSWA